VVKKLIQIFQILPLSLKVMILVFLAIPIFMAQFLPNPIEVFFKYGYVVAGFEVLAYFVVPYLLIISIIKRHVTALPLYLVECIAIGLYLFWLSPIHGNAGLMMNFLLVLSILIGGVMLLSKDQLLPMLAKRSRLWRKNYRYPINQLVKVKFENSDEWHPLLINNYSSGGVALTSFKEFSAKYVENNSDNSISVTFLIQNKKTKLDGIICWSANSDENLSFGLKCLDKNQLQNLADCLPQLKHPFTLADHISKFWEKPEE